jgi:hypothetical protein
MFHATNLGSNAGDTVAKHVARSCDSGAIMVRIYWAIAESDPTVNPNNVRANIAYNTLPYNFARMLPLPQVRWIAPAPADKA